MPNSVSGSNQAIFKKEIALSLKYVLYEVNIISLKYTLPKHHSEIHSGFRSADIFFRKLARLVLQGIGNSTIYYYSFI